jgi:hypothetical protein
MLSPQAVMIDDEPGTFFEGARVDPAPPDVKDNWRLD